MARDVTRASRGAGLAAHCTGRARIRPESVKPWITKSKLFQLFMADSVNHSSIESDSTLIIQL
jgi:hypothetical protein